jgi:hypothetical protein
MTPQPREWTFEPFDAGMGETEYNIFADDVFFARVNNRADVASLIHAMKLANPRPATSPIASDEVGDMCDQVAEVAAARAREKVLGVFSEVEYLHDVDGITYPDLYNEFIQRYKSLRTGGEPAMTPGNPPDEQ